LAAGKKESLRLIFNRTGEVRDGFFVTGWSHNPIYLLKSKEPVLFDGGLALLGKVYRDAITSVLNGDHPRMVFVTHVHFDHCGAVPYLKKVFPGLKAAASQKAKDILKRPNAIKLIRKLSESDVQILSEFGEDSLCRDPFDPFEVDLVLQDGDEVELEEGLRVRVLSTPGHTWDFISYYVPEKKILVASEAAGCALSSGYISSDGLADFGVYLSSLKRLASLDAQILCQGHRYVYLDEDVEAFFQRSLQTALEFKAMVQECWLKEKGDLGRVLQKIKETEYDPLPIPKQPEPAFVINLEARIKSVLNHLGLEKGSSL
jgi:glyoxylase-like metal-dependent hydrolase (beta-lactamase superfamily II)